MRIRLKMLIIIVCVVLVTGVAATLIGRTIAMGIVKDQISDHLVTTARSRTLHINSVLQYKINNAELFAEQVRLVLANGEAETIAEDTRGFSFVTVGIVDATEDIDRVLFLDENGTVIVTSDPHYAPPGTDLSYSEAFVKGRESTFVGGFDVAESIGEFMLCTASPLAMDSRGYQVGAILFLGGEQTLIDIAADATGLGDTGEVYVVNSDGRLITPSRFGAGTDGFMDMSALPTGEDGGEQSSDWQAVSSTNYRGDKVLGVYHYMPEVGWTLVVEKASAEAFAPVSRLTNITLWVLLGLLALGAVFAFLISRTMSKPIERLHKGTEEIMKGNWDYHVSTQARGEIGELSRAFGRMTENLRKSQEELRQYSIGLEAKVRERTQALSESNQALGEEITERKRAEDALREARDDLEKRVEERTSELVDANDEIQVRAFELEASNEELRDTQAKLIETNRRLQSALDDVKASQEQLLQSAKLAAVGELVSGVAHDLNNPLAAIAMASEMLVEDIGDENGELRLIILQAERAINIVENLLRFARKHGPQREYLSINDAIESTIELSSYELAISEIRVVRELDPYVPKTMADYRQLQQVFLNLIGNARHAMRDAHGRGTLVLRTEYVAGIIQVCISDDGPGIPEETMERIFEPFFTTKEVGIGTGLGLSICKGIVKEHGGTVYVESTVGNGTTFVVELPVVTEEAGCPA